MQHDNKPVVTRNFLKQLSRGAVKSLPVGGALLEQIIYGTLDAEAAEKEKRKLDAFLSALQEQVENQGLTIKQVLSKVRDAALLQDNVVIRLNALLRLLEDPDRAPLDKIIREMVDRVLKEQHFNIGNVGQEWEAGLHESPRTGAHRDYAYVKLYSNVVGIVVWDNASDVGRFKYHPEFFQKGLEPSPLLMPVDTGQKEFAFCDLPPLAFKGLPGLLSDSLPDQFGNAIIDAWLASQGIAPSDFSSVKKLLYIGKRGMGALEYSPFLNGSIDRSVPIELTEVVEFSNRVVQEYAPGHIDAADLQIQTLHEILKVGGSAGGRRPKIIIGFNSHTGEIYSGQAEIPKGFQHWILKLDILKGESGQTLQHGRIEFAYYNMALNCGINMSESRLLETKTGAHFMTRRFDRIGTKEKVHSQTLCALAHYDFNHVGAYSYEQAFAVIHRLGLPPTCTEQLFRIMVFNVVARNYDDHTKNISFLMTETGKWSLAPAYDLTHAYNPHGEWTSAHQMTINGKRERITRYDLVSVGIHQGIHSCEQIIDDIFEAVSGWPAYAEQAGVSLGTSANIGRSHLTHGELSPKNDL